MKSKPDADPLISGNLAVRALCDMARRRGLHASRVEAEQAWHDVNGDDAQRKFAAAWQWLFPGHSATRVPLQLAHVAQLPAWVLVDGNMGIVTALASGEEPVRIEWLGDTAGPGDEVTEILVPVSPGLIDDAPMVPPKQRGPASLAIRAALKNHLPLFLRVGITTVLMNLIAIVSSLFAMQVYDRVVPNFAYSTLFVLASGVFLAYVIDIVIKVVRLKLLEASALRLDEALSLYFFEKVMALKLDRRPSRVGTLVAQIKDYESIKNFFTSTTLFVLADLPFVLLFIGVIGMIGGYVALVLAVFAPICLIIGLVAYRPMARLQKAQTDEMARRTGVLFEAVAGSETIKGQGGEARFGDVWLKSTRLGGRNGYDLRNVSSYATFASYFFQQLAWVLVLIVGVYMIEAGNLTMGGLIACSILATRVLSNISQITQLLLQWHHAQHALEVLNRLLSCPTDDVPDRQGNTNSAPLSLGITELQYAYQGAQAPQLVVPALNIKQGERIAVLGGNGSGKSTLLRLLAGLATPSAGEVRIAGLDMQHCRTSWLREVIGYLPQEVRLFSGTLVENLTLGLPMPEEGRIREALEKTGLIQAVDRHPMGLTLRIHEGGAGLSGGQRQLVGLTRLLLQDPKIWLLDEPSASLDSEAEARLQNLIKQLPRDRTVLFTSHRPTWLAMADRVLVIQDGQIKVDAPADKIKVGPAAALAGKPAGPRPVVATTAGVQS